MANILIVDDHSFIREGIIRMLKTDHQIRIAGEFSSGKAALKGVSKIDHDLVILDISLPDTNGLYVLERLKIINPNIPVLMLSMHPEEQYAKRAFKLGASGYISKDVSSDEFIIAVKKILKGDKYVSQSFTENLIFDLLEKTVVHPHEKLSDREFQVMCMIAEGQSISEISEILSLSPKTVSTYRSRISQKLNLKNVAQITSYAIHNKLI